MLSILPSPSSHPYFHPLHYPSFSYAKIHYFPSNYPFCPFSFISLPRPHLTLPFSPNLSPDYSSLITCQPTIPTLHNPNLLQSLTQAPYTTTEKHTKHKQGLQNPGASALLPSLTYPTCLYSLFNKIRDKGKIVSAGYQGGGREKERVGWVVREGVGGGEKMTPALYAHMNNKKIKRVTK
jgi:hypothetical protein